MIFNATALIWSLKIINGVHENKPQTSIISVCALVDRQVALHKTSLDTGEHSRAQALRFWWYGEIFKRVVP